MNKNNFFLAKATSLKVYQEQTFFRNTEKILKSIELLEFSEKVQQLEEIQTQSNITWVYQKNLLNKPLLMKQKHFFWTSYRSYQRSN